MDDRFLRYLKEEEQQPLTNPPIEGFTYPNFEDMSSTNIPGVLDQEQSARVEQVLDNDTSQPDQPMNVQSRVENGPVTDKELITDVFKKLGWDKYIKEESIIGEQNANK